MASIALSDGDRSLELAGLGPTGIWTTEFDPPVPVDENTYADSADSVGRRRIRSKTQNPTGRWKGVISHKTPATFWDWVDNLQEMVTSVHERRGSLVYQPPTGSSITYMVESMHISGLPQRGTQLNVGLCEPEIEFETRPYGLLDEVTIFSGVTFAGPIAGVTVTGVPGHVPAWGELTLTDSSTQQREHVEVAVQPDFDPANPEVLLIDSGAGLVTSGFEGTSTSRSGQYGSSVIRATLSSTPVVVCSTDARTHKGPWRIRVRIYPSSVNVRMRLSWRVGEGIIEQEPWKSVPGQDAFFDLDLGVIDIEPQPVAPDLHRWTGFIEAYAPSGTPTIDVDVVWFLPA